MTAAALAVAPSRSAIPALLLFTETDDRLGDVAGGVRNAASLTLEGGTCGEETWWKTSVTAWRTVADAVVMTVLGFRVDKTLKHSASTCRSRVRWVSFFQPAYRSGYPDQCSFLLYNSNVSSSVRFGFTFTHLVSR